MTNRGWRGSEEDLVCLTGPMVGRQMMTPGFAKKNLGKRPCCFSCLGWIPTEASQLAFKRGNWNQLSHHERHHGPFSLSILVLADRLTKGRTIAAARPGLVSPKPPRFGVCWTRFGVLKFDRLSSTLTKGTLLVSPNLEVAHHGQRQHKGRGSPFVQEC